KIAARGKALAVGTDAHCCYAGRVRLPGKGHFSTFEVPASDRAIGRSSKQSLSSETEGQGSAVPGSVPERVPKFPGICLPYVHDPFLSLSADESTVRAERQVERVLQQVERVLRLAREFSQERACGRLPKPHRPVLVFRGEPSPVWAISHLPNAILMAA